MAITTSDGKRYDALENFIGDSPSEYVKISMNDPKPANDNDNRKPMRGINWDEFSSEDVDFMDKLSSIPTHMENLRGVKPSENVIYRNTVEGFKKEAEYDKKIVEENTSDTNDSLHIGLKDLDTYLEKAEIATDARSKLLRELQKRVIVPSTIDDRIREFRKFEESRK